MLLIQNASVTWQTRVSQFESHLHLEAVFLSALMGGLRSWSWDTFSVKELIFIPTSLLDPTLWKDNKITFIMVY